MQNALGCTVLLLPYTSFFKVPSSFVSPDEAENVALCLNDESFDDEGIFAFAPEIAKAPKHPSR